MERRSPDCAAFRKEIVPMVLSVADAVVDVVGFMGGLLLASSWVAQIYRAHKRRSALDLSYSMQVR